MKKCLLLMAFIMCFGAQTMAAGSGRVIGCSESKATTEAHAEAVSVDGSLLATVIVEKGLYDCLVERHAKKGLYSVRVKIESLSGEALPNGGFIAGAITALDEAGDVIFENTYGLIITSFNHAFSSDTRRVVVEIDGFDPVVLDL